MTVLISPSAVIAFWKEAGPAKWYARDAEFDQKFRDAGRALHWAAARRELESWLDTAEGALALILLLDQYPRNSFRRTAHAYATDGLALAYARRAIESGWPQAFEPDLRQFFFLPFEHSERIEDHDALAPLVADMPETAKWAKIHRDIIVRFGRYPHRNKALGRDTTPEEQAFLDAGGFAG